MSALQLGLFGTGGPVVVSEVAAERADLGAGAWVEVSRGWLRGADTLCQELIGLVPWCHRRRWMYERYVDEPRLTCRYERGSEVPHPALGLAGGRLEGLYGVPLAGPGLNYYRDGRDSVAFHADRELKQLGNTIVAIVTLGATRPFLVRPRGGGRSVDFRPASGDLLVMGGACQAHFEHAVPKTASCGPRVSATWRWPQNDLSGRPQPSSTRRQSAAAAADRT